ncbi:hypothetical protein LTS08_003437 [Lithohypha guttulata]|nr:hypothetical protein LTS08_003437 [Lithohypha guttulata]
MFEWVMSVEYTAFVLIYGEKKGTVLASKFCPDAALLNATWVYSHGFDKTVTNGHVLRLRHEFTMDADEFEEEAASRLGTANLHSVKIYHFPPKNQDIDIVDTRTFYKLPTMGVFLLHNFSRCESSRCMIWRAKESDGDGSSDQMLQQDARCSGFLVYLNLSWR